MFGGDIGIDLGTASVLVYIKGQGIVINEPAVVAIDKTNNSIMAIGEQARRMLGRTPDNIEAIRPLRDGVISNFDATEKMLKFFIHNAIGRSFFRKPRIAVCVPSNVSEVEQRSVRDATKKAGAREVFVIEEPIAAAIGAGIDISRPQGSMIIDIGGGTSDVAVISLGSCVVSESIKTAGDHFDEAIIRFLRKKYNVLIGERTAEMLKVNIGTAFEREPLVMDVRGRNIINGLPKTVEITSHDIHEALAEPLSNLVDAIHRVLEQTPPELSSDLSDRGIMMTGGGSLLHGLDVLITHKTGIRAMVAENAITAVAYGTGSYIEYISSDRNKKDNVTKRGMFRGNTPIRPGGRAKQQKSEEIEAGIEREVEMQLEQSYERRPRERGADRERMDREQRRERRRILREQNSRGED